MASLGVRSEEGDRGEGGGVRYTHVLSGETAMMDLLSSGASPVGMVPTRALRSMSTTMSSLTSTMGVAMRNLPTTTAAEIAGTVRRPARCVGLAGSVMSTKPSLLSVED